jgi:hypothetical protein
VATVRRWRRSVVAVDALAALVALLGLDGEGCDRSGIEALEADRLAGLLAVTVRAILDSLQRSVDLRNELALAVATYSMVSVATADVSRTMPAWPVGRSLTSLPLRKVLMPRFMSACGPVMVAPRSL